MQRIWNANGLKPHLVRTFKLSSYRRFIEKLEDVVGLAARSPAFAVSAIVRAGRTEQRIALRARIVLGAADGRSNNALAKELKISRPTVIDWRNRYAAGSVQALYADRPRGRSFKPLNRGKEAEVVEKTQTAPPHRDGCSPTPFLQAVHVARVRI